MNMNPSLVSIAGQKNYASQNMKMKFEKTANVASISGLAGDNSRYGKKMVGRDLAQTTPLRNSSHGQTRVKVSSEGIRGPAGKSTKNLHSMK